jgi:mono/diheme cytochrome c family protein
MLFSGGSQNRAGLRTPAKQALHWGHSMKRISLAAAIVLAAALGGARGADSAAVERGRLVIERRVFLPAAWLPTAYDEAWRQWSPLVKDRPEPYGAVFREHYGLHPAPFDNGPYPMGLRQGRGRAGRALTTDCLLCHGGSILGKSYVGLGNAALDVQAFFEDMSKASGGRGKLPFTFSNSRGTSEAGGMAVFLLSFRNPDLSQRFLPLDLGLRDDLCEDVPAWWLLKKKRTMYHTGTGNARSVRSLMQFMLVPGNDLATMEREEPAFRDLQAYLLSLEAPKYPYPIDRGLAKRGEVLFNKSCARCHGTYGEDWTYPNKIVPVEVVGTDPTRFRGFSARMYAHYNRSWFAREKPGWLGDGYAALPPRGYQAPPLDGIWATAPYFHNGSVPTVYNVLNSRSRPRIFTRSFRTDATAYDAVKIGWKVQVLEHGADPDAPAYERRKVYDTTKPGRGNGGHTFGDALTEEERVAVVEYLKTL